MFRPLLEAGFSNREWFKETYDLGSSQSSTEVPSKGIQLLRALQMTPEVDVKLSVLSPRTFAGGFKCNLCKCLASLDDTRAFMSKNVSIVSALCQSNTVQ